MEKLLIGIFVIVAAVLVLMVLPLIGSLLGAFSGWVVGLFFSETILPFLAALGIKGFAMWEVGMSLGFIGGFFRAVQSNNNK